MLVTKALLALLATATLACAQQHEVPNNLYVRNLEAYARNLENEIHARDMGGMNPAARDTHPHPELVAQEVAHAMKRDVLKILNARMPHVVCEDKECEYNSECQIWNVECAGCDVSKKRCQEDRPNSHRSYGHHH